MTRLLGSGVTYTLISLRSYRRRWGLHAAWRRGFDALAAVSTGHLGFDVAALDLSPFVEIAGWDTQWSGCVLSVGG